MSSGRRALYGSLTFTCYVLWAAFAICVAASLGLWLVGKTLGDGSDTSSAYAMVSDNSMWLLIAGIGLLVVAAALSWFVDRTAD